MVPSVAWRPSEELGIFRWRGVLYSNLFTPHLFSTLMQVTQARGPCLNELHIHTAHCRLSESMLHTEVEWLWWLHVP